MFWKSVKNIFSETGSFSLRLTLFYTLLTCLLITLTSLFLYWAMVNVLYEGDYQFLSDEMRFIEKILAKTPPDLAALRQEVVDIPLEIPQSVYHYYIRVLDEHNRLIVETPGMQQKFPFDAFFKTNIESLNHSRGWWRSTHSENYLLMQAPHRLGNQNRYWLVQMALDIFYQQKVIDNYRKKLWLMIFLGGLTAVLIGYIIARRSMRRLNELTETARKITATSLAQRIDPNHWPKELRDLGLAFNHMLERIEGSFSRLNQFSADLAHELRTPINNLMGETEIALSRGHNTKLSIKEYQHILESNLEELHRLSQMIENLMFLARAENPQLEIKKEYLKVEDEIALIQEFYSALAEEKNITVSSEGKASLAVNPIMFRRLLSNLLSNALKYTENNGWIKFQVKEINHYEVRIMIQDNGIGIASDHLPQIFDRFYRIDSARSQQSGGIGLGLAIVKSIVSLHQGMITIESVLKQGTTISVVFPK